MRNGAGQSTTASSENSRPRSCHQHDFHGRWSRRAARVPRLKIAVADAPDSAIFPTGWSRRAAGVTTGKEDRTRPHLFPAAGHAHEALHWGQRRRVPAIICDKCGLTPHFARSALVASRKMLRLPGRAQGLSERQRVKTCSEYRFAPRTLAGGSAVHSLTLL